MRCRDEEPGGKDHKWLLHSNYLRSFGRDNNKRLVPIGCRLSFWSEDYDRLVPPGFGARLGGWRRRTPWDQISQVAGVHRPSAFI